MSIWKDQGSPRKDGLPPNSPTGALPPEPRPAADPGIGEPVAAVAAAAPTPVRAAAPAAKESLIAADITIEGKIEGTGHIRIAGKFKGDVNVQGDLTIETGAKLSGGVRANKVIIAGELEGNIESASQVELLASGALIGDVKAGSLTVAAGARMRGQADFGWEDDKSGRKGGKPAESDAGA
ncbi:polymer-forming cytoskeletal protein [Xanthomonas sp. AmX2]|uniref:bactofilin family protein n=1 Tax=Xanthomonas sp. TaxID=29446 RepID=UPI00197D4907|nr:polymer-forming cytoskeletal protein [Xanthomonas sp.]MBN6152503.1 polymer-forming cytoskeletal protein [Xanthomonas sp.]